MPVAALKNLNLYYEIHGAEDAAPLVLLHGATETFRACWRRQIEPFSRRYRLIGLDLRGHGRSDNPAGKLDLRQMADDVRDLLDHLRLDKVHLLGYSGGGSTALFFGLRHPERLRSLTLASNNMELDRARGQVNFWDLARIRREEPRWWQAMTQMHGQPAEKLLQWWAEEDSKRPNFQPGDLQHLHVPTLVVGGDRDPIIPLEQTLKLFRALPDAYLCILPGVGHGAPRLRPQAFNQAVLDFLQFVA